MNMMKHIQTWLLITLLALSANGVANAKLASGHQNLSADLHQSQTVLNALLHQGLGQVSTTNVSGSPLAAKETSYLYRGVHANHPALNSARKGDVVPGNVGGNVSPELHNAGGHAANSPFTSWTRDINIARQHAGKSGDGGLLLRVPQGAPSSHSRWSWEWSPDIFGEQEVLLRGIRKGAEVVK